MGSEPPLELRVHGVSGTPPQALLDRPLVEQVAGDRTAGFWRPRLAEEQTDDAPSRHAPKRAGAPPLVGYNWGGLTSGSAGRALWLPLLPFTLLNIAPRARPERAGRRQTWWIWYLSRLLALLGTGLFVLTGVGVGVDLMGWQCAHTPKCSSASPATLFRRTIVRHDLSDEHMLIVGAIVPVLFLSLLWLVSSRTANRYERTVVQIKDVSGTTMPAEVNDTEVGLTSTLMWRNAVQVRRLRATHMQTSFALIIWSVAAPTERRWGFGPGDPSAFGPRLALNLRSHPIALLAAAVMGYGALTLALRTYVGRGDSVRWQRASYVVWLVLIGSGGWLGYGLGFRTAWIQHEYLGVHRASGLPFFAPTVLADFSSAVVILGVLLFVVCFAARRGGGDAIGQQTRLRPALRGMAAFGFASLGLFFAATFASGVYTYAGAWLTTGSVKPGFSEVGRVYSLFHVPESVRAASHAYLLSTVFLVVVLVSAGAIFVAGLSLGPAVTSNRTPTMLALTAAALADFVVVVLDGPVLLIITLSIITPALAVLLVVEISSPWLVDIDALHLDYPDAESVTADGRRRTSSIWRAMYLGRLVDCVPFVIAPLILTGLVAISVYGGPLPFHHEGDPKVPQVASNIFSPSSATAAGVGAYLTVLTILGLVSLGTLAFRTESLRRTVGILWDVASFWPRASHPLAPPCYAERTVPDLVTYLSAQESSAIVLAAHSQGTVISAAAISQLATYDDLGVPRRSVVLRLGFLTFGCVLRRLYGRYFPAYFGPSKLNDLQHSLGGATPRWRNLWRYTDYLGGQVTAGPGPTQPVVDPAVSPRRLVGPQPWEWHSPDPHAFDRPPGDVAYPDPHRHSDFWADRSGYFQDAVVDLISQIP